MRKQKMIQRTLALLAFALAIPAAAAAEDNWPRWRGASFNGAAPSGAYPVKWTPDNALWKTAIPGKGFSTPIIWQKKIFLTTGAGGKDTLMALDWSGKPLWQTPVGTEKPGRHSNASGSNSSPVTDGKTIFVCFKSGNLAALSLSGAIRWQTNLFERFGKDDRFWDFGTSPVLTRKHVIMAQMHEGDSYLAAFDKQTGRLSWKAARNYKTPMEGRHGYTTPIVLSRNGKESLLVWGAHHLTLHDAADGRIIWTCGDFNPKAEKLWPAVASPVLCGDMAVVPCGRADRRNPRLHGIKLGGAGDVTRTHRLWERQDVGTFVPTPAAHVGRAYVVGDLGSVTCLDPETGKTLWQGKLPKGRGKVYASPLIAGGHLYVARESGIFYVIRIRDNFEVAAEIDMGEKIIASPIALDGRLLIRTRGHLYCFAPPGKPLNRKVHAFYYGWYGNPETDGHYSNWNHQMAVRSGPPKRFPGGASIGADFYPQLGCYSANDKDTLAAHMGHLERAGVGVIAVSWWGKDTFTDKTLAGIFEAAGRHGIKVSFHIEPFPGRSAATTRHAMAYLLDKYGRHEALYRDEARGNRPLFYVYDSYHIPAKEWAAILSPAGAETIRGTPHDALVIGLWVKEKEAAYMLTGGFDGFYTYFATTGFTYGSTPAHWKGLSRWARQNGLIFIPCVGPGYEDRRIRPWNGRNARYREKGAYYARMFQAAIEAAPPIIGITSFNEWHEGTQIEPAVPKKIDTFTYLDYSPLPPEHYLDLTREWCERFQPAR